VEYSDLGELPVSEDRHNVTSRCTEEYGLFVSWITSLIGVSRTDIQLTYASDTG